MYSLWLIAVPFFILPKDHTLLFSGAEKIGTPSKKCTKSGAFQLCYGPKLLRQNVFSNLYSVNDEVWMSIKKEVMGIKEHDSIFSKPQNN